MKKLALFLVVVLCVTLGAYFIKGWAEEKVLATVNGVNITQKDFDDEVSAIPANYRAMVNANKAKFLDDLVLQELLAQEAKNQGLDKDPDFLKSLEKIKNKLLAKDLIEKEVVESTKVSEENAKKYYNEHKDEFAVPEQVNASHILIIVKEGATDAEKKAAKEKAEGLLKKVKGGADFSALAKENSDCPSKAKGGELGFFSKGQMVPEFEDAAFKLKPGEISNIVETKFGYHIIKVTDRKPAGQEDFAEVKDEIEQKLLRDKQKTAFDDYTKKLKDSANITIAEETAVETKSLND